MWRTIPNYEGLYEASTDGRIRSVDRITPHGHLWKGRELKQTFHTAGYLAVTLCKDGIPFSHLVHRLIAETFIDNPDNLGFINHKDENKHNNNVSNLEWCTKQYNNTYNGKLEKQKQYTRKPVVQMTMDGKTLIVHESGASAASAVGVNPSAIMRCCQGVTKTCKGFKWMYV